METTCQTHVLSFYVQLRRPSAGRLAAACPPSLDRSNGKWRSRRCSARLGAVEVELGQGRGLFCNVVHVVHVTLSLYYH